MSSELLHADFVFSNASSIKARIREDFRSMHCFEDALLTCVSDVFLCNARVNPKLPCMTQGLNIY